MARPQQHHACTSTLSDLSFHEAPPTTTCFSSGDSISDPILLQVETSGRAIRTDWLVVEHDLWSRSRVHTHGSQLILLLFLQEFSLIVITSIILCDVLPDKSVCYAKDVEQPEEIQTLQGAEKCCRDVVRQIAFVLLGLPIELIRTNGLELCEF